MSKSRTVEQLRTAAADAGWLSDPLATEIIEALTELERQKNAIGVQATTTPAPAAPPPQLAVSPSVIATTVAPRPKSSFWSPWIAVPAAALLVAVLCIVDRHNLQLQIKMKDDALSRAQEVYAAQISQNNETRKRLLDQVEALTVKLESALKSAESVADATNVAARTNRVMVDLCTDRLLPLLNEFKKQTATAVKPEKETPPQPAEH